MLIEAMTYRGGHHSTSDDSSRYRSNEEIKFWFENDNPIARLRLLLESRGLWDADKETAMRSTARDLVLASLLKAERNS